MAPFLLLLILLSGAASGLIVVTVHPGDDVILPCQAAGSSIRVLEWTRPDLKPDIVLLYRGGHLTPEEQNPSFKDRVELVDRDLKDGDVSLTLKNVSRHDAGTYECRVKPADTNQITLISTIRLLVPDLVVVPVPGDDVTLPCQAAGSSIRAVEWTRPDLEPEYVLLYRDGHLETDHQHPSFKDRVELVDRDLKDGDVSLILKNVNSIDNGTYECRVKPAGSRRERRAIIDSEPIRIIRLQVPEPAGPNSGRPEDGNPKNDVPEDRNSSPVVLIVGLVAGGLVLVAAAVGGGLMYKRREDNRSGQPAAAADDDDDDEALGDALV
ncbi:coxsackievirus and adenovirus receptor-like isoform X2 [Perca flavescens]|uniref:coxsackievirus and adenovirus receptor-like isoform X2 n=1 Tax=Perca flavescens TaxID=8167 RepID=UPI00106E025A|nr:coxsackievirus and adenovirus receptor-like isoform X2 [Perca flavescens]